jgi:hypothetical protein
MASTVRLLFGCCSCRLRSARGIARGRCYDDPATCPDHGQCDAYRYFDEHPHAYRHGRCHGHGDSYADAHAHGDVNGHANANVLSYR